MESTNIKTVSIFGREYKIKGQTDEEYIQEMASYVDGKMKELAANSSLPSHERLAVLAALNIADELFQERRGRSETFSSVERQTDQLISLLDESLLVEK